MTSTPTPVQPVATPPLPKAPAASWLSLSCNLIAVFLQLLDNSIVHVALPHLSSIGAGPAEQVLTVTVYTLAFACTLITAARLGDVWGRRRVFLGALVGFGLSSTWCALATGAGELVIARGVQGVFAGAMGAQSLAIISATFPKALHSRVLGLYGAVTGLAVIFGPLIGGALIGLDLFGWGWRWVFLVNVPLVVLAVVIGLVWLLDSRGEAVGIDWVGAALSALGLFLVILPLSTAGAHGAWALRDTLTMLAGLLVLVGFVLWERWWAARGHSPILRIDIFADPVFRTGALMAGLFFATLTALMFTWARTLQDGYGFTALQAGLLTLPWALGSAVFSVVAAFVSDRIGNRVLTLGCLLTATSVLSTALVMLVFRPDLPIAWLLGSMVLGGMGLGFFVAPLQTAILASVRRDQAGSASGLLPTLQQVGTAVGVAVIVAVYFRLVGPAAAHGTPGTREQIEAYSSGQSGIFIVAGLISVVLAALTFVLPRFNSRDDDPLEGAAE